MEILIGTRNKSIWEHIFVEKANGILSLFLSVMSVFFRKMDRKCLPEGRAFPNFAGDHREIN